MAYLVALGYFVSVDIVFLMVGHTHEDVDQLFAVVCEYLGRRRDFQVPMAVIEYLREALQERVARKGEEFKVLGSPVSVTTMLGSTHCRSSCILPS